MRFSLKIKIGIKATCLSSEKFEAQVWREGRSAQIFFEKGNLINYNENSCEVGKSGTYIRFKPDKEVFKNMIEGFSYKRICEEIKSISYLNKKINFVVENKNTGEKKSFYSENGIMDFIGEYANNPLMKPIVCAAKDNQDELEIAFVWTSLNNEQEFVFVNGLQCPELGTPITGIKSTITNFFKRYTHSSTNSELYRRGLVCAVNCKVVNPSFANQTKSKINNPNLRSLASQAMKEGLEIFSHSGDFAKIIEMMKKIEKAEKAAEKARENVLNQEKEINKELKKKSVLAGKLADCRYHDERSQLLIVEGLSAQGSIIKSRNSDYTAAFPLTGKILNVLKSNEEKQFKNEVLKNIHTALGCGYGDNFNIKKLRYGRIVLVADMDEDGFSIMCLLLTFFYHYYPQLITSGKIYWGQTPLFKVVSNNKTYYTYNEQELANLPKGDIIRAKGIGELEAIDFRATLFSENGHYIKFLMNDVENAVKYFDILMGENIKERKEYISKNADFDALD